MDTQYLIIKLRLELGLRHLRDGNIGLAVHCVTDAAKSLEILKNQMRGEELG